MMKGRESAFLVLGIGSGTAVEALLFLSPLFEMILWKPMCSYVKIVPLATLIPTGVIGSALLPTALLFLGVLVEDMLTIMRRSP
jgi:hypothetical protein